MFGDVGVRLTRGRLVAAAVVVTGLVVGLVPASTHVGAHDGIASSDPATGSVIDDPIDSVTVDFGADIGDTAQIAVFLPDGTQITSDTTVTSSTTATTTFETIDEHGTYTVNYLATSIVDGHVLGGSLSFTYGDTSSNTFPPLLFALIAIIILGIGGWFSWRARRRSRHADADEVSTIDAA